ncbi:MAG: hypothetical protein ACO3ND_10485, partial [Opitutales bacterium]
MGSAGAHRIRWKGTVTGPFEPSRIQDMLRAGEISLVHAVESDGRWITVREFMKPRRATLDDGRAEQRAHARPASPEPEDRAEEARVRTDDSIERAVREGYLWCGSTFLLPPAFGLLVWMLVQAVPGMQPISRYVLLSFCAIAGCLIPVAMVRRVGQLLDQEGLGDLRQAQARLSVMLAGLGLAFWLVMF